MTKEEITEGNLLIARFIGWQDIKIDTLTTTKFKTTYVDGIESPTGRILRLTEINSFLNYHADWNLLMDVVDKIIEIDITPVPNWKGYRIEIVPRGYVGITGFPMEPIYTNVSIEGSLVNAVYKAVLTFIKYYNSTNKIKS